MSAIDLLVQHPALLYLVVLLFALSIGSFLNVVILRLPRIMEDGWRVECAELLGLDERAAAPDGRFSLAFPGSHCPKCKHRLRIWENIPILSWLLLRGHCSRCDEPISIRYPLIEAATAILSLIVIWQLGPTERGIAALVLTWGLIALAVIDAETQLLPDSITLPLLWIGLGLSLFGVFVDSDQAIIGAICGYLSLWLIAQLFRLTTGKEGMGQGDFKLFALFGAWLGWTALPQILLLSTVPGAVFGIAMMLIGRKQRGTPVPFGPFLAIAGWISVLWGDSITNAYLRWAGL
jgi:leader peptidase (prepilin peptidase)/N-methyltransferase